VPEVVNWLDIGWMAEAQFPAGSDIFLFATVSRQAVGPTVPTVQWVSGNDSPGITRPERDTDHSYPSSANVKIEDSCTFTPLYVFIS
jgi:hypothetical protein